ncbi:transglycosylase SLT domain-containing protein [Streptomyces sp. N2-109]|uniref:Transglycosylase SLT domain-containing protein n=1 Tax=Streptomyces gossypii TaxID=2883101 RepID=A0ABT2JZR6_9ACTN|nr:transglycosylase SLT domain-containing protein [Streptomyces gossypii]MCT2593356.1 transglycosylase SLT domain-containing protein [Streptomyces gossypii]
MLNIPRYTRMTKATRYSAVGLLAGAAALSLTVVPGSADDGDDSQSTATTATAQPVAFTGQAEHPEAAQKGGIAQQVDAVQQRVQEEAAAKKKAAEEKKQAAEKKKAAEQAAEKKKDAAQQAKAEKTRADEAASRSADRSGAKSAAAKPTYSNSLDGWIREARAIMKEKGIPGSYEGIHRNIIRESAGDPNAVNNWDINAQNGIPSKGLLQVIQPTFDAYHVKGTPKSLTDPVANIVAACNYAADRYGSMDNVDSAY